MAEFCRRSTTRHAYRISNALPSKTLFSARIDQVTIFWPAPPRIASERPKTLPPRVTPAKAVMLRLRATLNPALTGEGA